MITFLNIEYFSFNFLKWTKDSLKNPCGSLPWHIVLVLAKICIILFALSIGRQNNENEDGSATTRTSTASKSCAVMSRELTAFGWRRVDVAVIISWPLHLLDMIFTQQGLTRWTVRNIHFARFSVTSKIYLNLLVTHSEISRRSYFSDCIDVCLICFLSNTRGVGRSVIVVRP